MRESIVTTEIVNSLKDGKAWAYKIPDTPVSMLRALRFSPEKPCDIIGCYRSTMFGIEVKQIKDFKAFGIKMLRKSQIESLEAIDASGGRAFVFLNIRIPASNGKKRVNRLVIFDWMHMRQMVEGRINFKKSEIESCEYISGYHGRFDLTPFFELF